MCNSVIWHWQGCEESVADHISEGACLQNPPYPWPQTTKRTKLTSKLIWKNQQKYERIWKWQGKRRKRRTVWQWGKEERVTDVREVGQCEEQDDSHWGGLKAQGGGGRRGTRLRNDRSWKNEIKGRLREEGRWEMHREMERECLEEAAALHPSTCLAWFFPLAVLPHLLLSHTHSLSFPCVGRTAVQQPFCII